MSDVRLICGGSPPSDMSGAASDKGLLCLHLHRTSLNALHTKRYLRRTAEKSVSYATRVVDRLIVMQIIPRMLMTALSIGSLFDYCDSSRSSVYGHIRHLGVLLFFHL